MLRGLRHHLFTTPTRCVKLFRDLRLAVHQYETNWLRLLRRLVYLQTRCGFHPGEALQDGLLDMQIPESALAATLSKRTLVKLQARVNPSRFDCLTEDKAIFYAYCGALGLPIPRLFGVVTHPAGFSVGGHPLRDDTEWEAFIAGLPDEFVVKPSEGVYGRGVEIFRRNDLGFAGSSSGQHSKENMRTAFFTDPGYSRFVIQERLCAHPAIEELSGSSCLQTARIVTDVDEQGTCRVAFAVLRIITGDLVTDNFDGGRSRNLLSYVDLSDGTLESAFRTAADGIGMERLSLHPRTSVRFKDFRVPDWEAACALVLRAAPLFPPMRTLGWDIGFTPEGPRIIEANRRWDPLNIIAMYTQKPDLIERVAAFLADLRHAPRRS